MKNVHMATPVLLALSQGLAPDAEPLVCDDLRGPESLFGEGMRTPRPLRACTYTPAVSEPCPDGRELPGAGFAAQCLLLWQAEGPRPLVDAAGQILQQSEAAPGDPASLNVPAPVFLAGKSTSSFALAWQLADHGFFPEWSSVVCSCQTEGRGQLRRNWHSPRGNLHVTFRLPESEVFAGDAASVVVGYLAVSALRRLGFPVSLKWPNDLVLDESVKVGGILLEERNGMLMAGMGVNLSEAPPGGALRDKASLPAGRLMPYHSVYGGSLHSSNACFREQAEADAPLAPFPFWRKFLCAMILSFAHEVVREGLSGVVEALNRHPGFPAAGQHAGEGAVGNEAAGCEAVRMPLLAWQGRQVFLSEGEGVSGRLLGVGPEGGLLLGLPRGREQEFFSGSLSLA